MSAGKIIVTAPFILLRDFYERRCLLLFSAVFVFAWRLRLAENKRRLFYLLRRLLFCFLCFCACPKIKAAILFYSRR